MRRALVALALLTTALPVQAAPRTVTSPQKLPADHARPRIFLGGSIDMGRAADWQTELVKSADVHGPLESSSGFLNCAVCSGVRDMRLRLNLGRLFA